MPKRPEQRAVLVQRTGGGMLNSVSGFMVPEPPQNTGVADGRVVDGTLVPE